MGSPDGIDPRPTAHHENYLPTGAYLEGGGGGVHDLRTPPQI